jgi:hypothetical protein
MSSLQQQLAALLGNDPVTGTQALEQLKMEHPAPADVFKEALAVEDQTFHGHDRLAQLFATFGPSAGSFLVSRIEQEKWQGKQLAADCFKFFRYDLGDSTARDLMNLVKRGNDFDAERMAIESLGQMGADGWARDIIEAVFGPDDNVFYVSTYTIEKLGPYAAKALARMVARESREDRVSSDLWFLNKFLKKIWNNGKINELYPAGESSLESNVAHGLSEITPVAVTPLGEEWLRGDWGFTQRLAAGAIGKLRLDRSAKTLAACLLEDSREVDVRWECASALMDFGTRSAMVALRPALKLYEQTERLRDAILWAYSALFVYAPEFPIDEDLVRAIIARGGEAKAQLVYGFGVLRQRPELIEEALFDQDAFSRATAALALARYQGSNAAPRLRALLREATTIIERLFIQTALVHAGEPGAAESLSAMLVALPPPDRGIFLLRHPWRREILTALYGTQPESSREAIAWAEVMREDLSRCTQEMHVVIDISLSHGAPVNVRVSVEKSRTVEPAVPASQGATAAPSPRSTVSGPSEQRTPKIFFSYSHLDVKVFKEVETALIPLTRDRLFDLWSDTRILAGADWKAAVKAALIECDLALLLVSDNFLASPFIASDELPQLLEAAETRGLKILWLPASASLYKKTKIEKYQALIDPKKPLDTFTKPKRKAKLVEIAEKILHATET